MGAVSAQRRVSVNKHCLIVFPRCFFSLDIWHKGGLFVKSKKYYGKSGCLKKIGGRKRYGLPRKIDTVPARIYVAGIRAIVIKSDIPGGDVEAEIPVFG